MSGGVAGQGFDQDAIERRLESHAQGVGTQVPRPSRDVLPSLRPRGNEHCVLVVFRVERPDARKEAGRDQVTGADDHPILEQQLQVDKRGSQSAGAVLLAVLVIERSLEPDSLGVRAAPERLHASKGDPATVRVPLDGVPPVPCLPYLRQRGLFPDGTSR